MKMGSQSPSPPPPPSQRPGCCQAGSQTLSGGTYLPSGQQLPTSSISWNHELIAKILCYTKKNFFC